MDDANAHFINESAAADSRLKNIMLEHEVKTLQGQLAAAYQRIDELLLIIENQKGK